MPTLRARRPQSNISPEERSVFETGKGRGLAALILSGSLDREDGRRVWAAARPEILPAWIDAHPGTRPYAWWKFDAPRWQADDMPERVRSTGAFWMGRLCEPRRRLGGVGAWVSEHLNIVPELPFGIPDHWVSAWQVAYYNGRAVDVHGVPIGKNYHEGHFTGVAVDPADPPVFESQATYLQRHGLLTPAELRRVPSDAFTPYVVAVRQETRQ